ncbi:MAG: twin-arginine translocase TatA/TatE family subunit [Nitrospirae bacterium]|nr:twin-arginine translocase TatA/TatE family subunit [Nitrospirota bacterium]
MQELILIFIVVLLVFGPKRLPEFGRAIGKGINELKRAMLDAKTEISRELDDVNKSKGQSDKDIKGKVNDQ